MFSIRKGTGILVAGAIVVSAAACADETGRTDDDFEDVPPAAEVAPTPAETGFTDASIVRVLDAVNSAEIDEAQLALERSQDEEVRQFAQRMITEHQQLHEQVPTTTAAPGTDPATPPPATEPQTPPANTPMQAGLPDEVVRQLQDESQSARSELESLEGAEFDRAYIDRQVTAHQNALDLIDRQLAPGAQDAELRQTLENARPVIESHLEEARQIQERLGGTATTPTS